MEIHELETQYAKLSKDMRERWTLERFHQLSEQRVHADCAFAVQVAQARPVFDRELERNEFGGIASAYGVPIETWMPTVIESGAFKESLADPKQRARVKVLYMHNLPIGVPTFMEERPDSLAVIGKISETSLGLDVLTLLRDRAVDEMSIGFAPVRYEYRERASDKAMVRHITEGRLWEFSPVSFGANSGAKITVVNSLKVADGTRLDVDQLAQIVAERIVEIHARGTQDSSASRVDEADPVQVRAEIERLQSFLYDVDPSQLQELHALEQALQEVQ